MTVNGKPVTRSEFEYSYNKNNEETVVDKKSVNEYVDLFVNFKLKVLAAEAAGIDTTADFRKGIPYVPRPAVASYIHQRQRP